MGRRGRRQVGAQRVGILVDGFREPDSKRRVGQNSDSRQESSDFRRDRSYADGGSSVVASMIDAGPSLEAAKGLTGVALLGYLVGHGWTARPSRIDGIAII